MNSLKPFSFSVCIMVLLFFTSLSTSSQNFSRATKTKSASCPKGTFFDLIDGGTCWSCPSGFKRTVYPVNGAKACKRAGGVVFAKAKNKGKGKGILRTKCPKGSFFDPNGNCYSCPNGYKRTIYAVKSNRACSRRVKSSLIRARKKSRLSF